MKVDNVVYQLATVNQASIDAAIDSATTTWTGFATNL